MEEIERSSSDHCMSVDEVSATEPNTKRSDSPSETGATLSSISHDEASGDERIRCEFSSDTETKLQVPECSTPVRCEKSNGQIVQDETTTLQYSPPGSYCSSGRTYKESSGSKSPTGKSFRDRFKSPCVGGFMRHVGSGSSVVSDHQTSSGRFSSSPRGRTDRPCDVDSSGRRTKGSSVASYGSSGQRRRESISSGSSSKSRKRKLSRTSSEKVGWGRKLFRDQENKSGISLHRSESSIVLFQSDSDCESVVSSHDSHIAPPEEHETLSSMEQGSIDDELNRSKSTGSIGQRLLPDESGRTNTLPITRYGAYGQFYASVHSIASILQNVNYADMLDIHIIDCRYPYEYEGGHICGAKNMPIFQAVLDYLEKVYKEAKKLGKNSCANQLIFFYCEYSSVRGPHMYRQVRYWDRNYNTYPFLFFPEMYLICGGYKKFFETYPELCEPCNYVTMRSNPTESQKWLKLVNPDKHKTLCPKKMKPVRRLSFDNGTCRVDRVLADEFDINV